MTWSPNIIRRFPALRKGLSYFLQPKVCQPRSPEVCLIIRESLVDSVQALWKGIMPCIIFWSDDIWCDILIIGAIDVSGCKYYTNDTTTPVVPWERKAATLQTSSICESDNVLNRYNAFVIVCQPASNCWYAPSCKVYLILIVVFLSRSHLLIA